MYGSETHYKDSIDAAAEREAEALAWLERELGVESPVGRLERERDVRRTAVEMGLPPARHYRYGRSTAIRAWLRIVDEFRAGRGIKVKVKRAWFDTPADRERRRREREAFGRVLDRRKMARHGAGGKFVSAS
jgi:hypothetical protein